MQFEETALSIEVVGAYLGPMNKTWFNTRLRMVGKTGGDLADAIGRDRAVVSRILNGHQTMTLEQAKCFAEVLGVDVSEVLVQAGMAKQRVAKVFRTGFSESDAANYEGSNHEAVQFAHIKQAMGLDRNGVEVWRMKSSAMSLNGILDGDFLLVDLSQSDRVKAGDAVVAQIYNNASASAVTVVRRFEPPVLVAGSMDRADQRVQVVDGVNVVIRGKVVAVLRR